MKLLAIAPYFPPRRRVGALRPYRFVTRVQAHGWEARVICLSTPGAELDPDAAGRLAAVERWEVSSPFDRTRGRAQSDLEQTARAKGPMDAVGGRVADVVDASFPVDTWAPLLTAAAPGMLRRARAYAPDLIWATADPWSSLGLAHHLSRRLGVPWVADLRDPWTLCPLRSGDRSALGRALDRRFEARWLGSAAAIGVTSRLTLERYAAAYPALATRMFSEPNSYDAALEPQAFDAAAAPRPADATRPLSLLFFGGFRDSAPPDLLIDALARAHTLRPDATFTVRSVGGLQGAHAERAGAAGVLSCFATFEGVPYAQATATMREADLLLLSAAPRRPEQIPAKLWDYLPAGRPILSLGRNPEIAEVLADTGLGLQVDPTAADAVEATARLLLDAHDRLRRGELLLPDLSADASRVAAHGADHSTARLLAHFERVLSERGA